MVHLLIARLQTSPLLWKVYIAFEIRVGELGRAKALLYRSLVFCPWVKCECSSPQNSSPRANAPSAIYLTAFGPLRSVFRPTELDELFATMVERQIRIRHDIEGYLEGWVDPDAMDVDKGSDVGDQEVEDVVA